jgi:NADP-reducing hydrogenase subunit HndD
MEAALRTVADILTGESLENIDYEQVRGVEGIKTATVNVAGKELKVAVASGLANARKLLDSIKNGEANYDFIEIMACPGGCVNGGGQVIQPSSVRSWVDLRELRAKATYEEDKALPIRKSHENPFIKKLYDEFYGEPGSHKAHEDLHTHYHKRENY